MQDNVHETLEEVLSFPEHYEFIEAKFGPHPRREETSEELKQPQANMLRDIWVRMRPILWQIPDVFMPFT